MTTTKTITIQRGKNVGAAIAASLPLYANTVVIAIDSVERNPIARTISATFTYLTH